MNTDSGTGAPVGAQEEEAGGGYEERIRIALSSADKVLGLGDCGQHAARIGAKLQYFSHFVKPEKRELCCASYKIQEAFCQILIAAGELQTELFELFTRLPQTIGELSDLSALAGVVQRMAREGLAQVEAARVFEKQAGLFADWLHHGEENTGGDAGGDIYPKMKSVHAGSVARE